MKNADVVRIMSLADLAPELISSIYRHLSSIRDVVNLSLTSRELHSMLPHSQKLVILFSVADHEMGPIQDIIQLATEHAGQAAYLNRSPPLSFALLVQISALGRIALKWEKLYISNRWGDQDYMHRRSLTSHERRMLRQAIYRYWLYCQVYHNRSFPRTTRLNPAIVHDRCQLLRRWPSDELVHLLDIRNVFQKMLLSQICPSDGDVYWRTSHNTHFFDFRTLDRISDLRKIRLDVLFHNVRDPAVSDAVDNATAQERRDRMMTGWGDEVAQYHIVQSMLKLTPSQLLWLYEHAVNKTDVESYVDQLGGDWFWENGETLLHTIILILHDRGMEFQPVQEAILDGKMGIALDRNQPDTTEWQA